MTKSTGRHTAPHIDSSALACTGLASPSLKTTLLSTALLRPDLPSPTFLSAAAPASTSHVDCPFQPRAHTERRVPARID